jgi:hypothetical protein
LNNLKKSQVIPTCTVINARALEKPDASPSLHLELKNHDVDLAIVTETWLKSTIPSEAISPNGFSVIRKDRPSNKHRGCVAVFCRNDWQFEMLNEF